MASSPNGHASLLDDTEETPNTSSPPPVMEGYFPGADSLLERWSRSFGMCSCTKRQLMVSAVVTVLLARITVLLLSDITGLANYLYSGIAGPSEANKTQSSLNMRLEIKLSDAVKAEIKAENIDLQGIGPNKPLSAEIKATFKSGDRNGRDKQPTFCERGMSSQWNITENLVITPENGENPYVCDAHTDGGGWIVLQHRQVGNVTFNRPWEEFKEGFGSLTGDFWLGNEKVHQLTSHGVWELRVELRFKSTLYSAHYDRFKLEGENSRYRLHIGEFSSATGLTNDLRDLDMAVFTTPNSNSDGDNSNNMFYGHVDSDINCASKLGASWWYSSTSSSADAKRCSVSANLNLPWRIRDADFWPSATAHSSFVGSYRGTGGEDVDMTQMKIRRRA